MFEMYLRIVSYETKCWFGVLSVNDISLMGGDC